MSAGDKDMIFSTENEKDIIENILFNVEMTCTTKTFQMKN